MHPRRLSVVLGLAVLLVLGAAAPGLLASPAAARQDAPTTPTVEPLVSLVQQVGPAVVTVTNLQTASGLGGTSGAFDPDSGRLLPAGSGTGFIISEDGYIVTNWHVVTGGEEFEVTFADGTSVAAELVGADEISDLAVVRVDTDETPVPAVVAFGDSEILLPGQSVIAIGSPLGAFENTVTEGIVSATNRDFPGNTGSQLYTNLIQHDAAINPGNSGGPLFNLSGEVIGVNTLGIPAVQGQPIQGLFFAIPSNEVNRVTQEIIAEGQVTYPYLGVNVVSLSPGLAAQADLSVDYGGYITNVVAGDPAAEAGIEPDDIIIAINGTPIDATNTFTETLYAQEPGATVMITVLRDGDEQEIEVTLGEIQRS